MLSIEEVERLEYILKKDMAEGYLSDKEEDTIENVITELKDLKKEKQGIVPAPKTFSTLNYQEINKILKKRVNCPVLLADRKYQLTSEVELKRFLKEDKTNLKKYISEYHDCDDFSWSLLGAINQGKWSGIAFGFAWSDVHAFNIFVTNNKTVKLIEPQTDNIINYTDANKKYYKLIRLVMM